MTFDARLRPFRAVIWMFAVFLLLQVGSAAVLFVQKLGLSPDSIARFYLGDEATFAQPKTLAGMMKVTVPHLLAIPLVLFITVHLVGCVGLVRRKPFAVAARLVFAFTLFGIAAGYGVRFIAPEIALAKLIAFVGLEAMLLFWLALLLVAFWPGRLARAVASADAAGRPAGWLRPTATRR